jgi:hypothetical protein
MYVKRHLFGVYFFAKNFFLELTNNSFITLRCVISDFEKTQACHGKQ